MNKKTIILIFGVLVLMMGVAFGVILVGRDQEFREKAAPATTITLDASDTSPSVGDSFTISATVDTGINQVVAAELYFEYNPDKIEITNVVNGPFFPTPEVIGPVIDNDAGKVDYVTFILPGDSPSQGQEVIVNLTARAKASGTAVVSLSSQSLVGATDEEAQNVLVSTFPVNIEIGGSAGGSVGGGNLDTNALTPTPNPTFAPTITLTPTKSVFVSPTSAFVEPDELPDTGISLYTTVGLAGAVLLIVGALGFAL